MGRGDLTSTSTVAVDVVASTGPRLLGRGDGSRRCWYCERPGQLQRGRAFWGAEIFRSLANSNIRYLSFNGAAPFGARRSGNGASARQRRSCFNGAAPFGARRFNAAMDGGKGFQPGFNGAAPFGARRSASMTNGRTEASWLQRGRAFWGAEIRRDLAGSDEFADASTGPRLLGRGDFFALMFPPSSRRASTGPRLLGRGDDQNQKPAPSPCQRASTGPRLLGRGDILRCVLSNLSIMCFNGAAPFGARRFDLRNHAEITRFAKLQRGRAFWGAEIPSALSSTHCLSSGFNGAAPFGARRLGRPFE